MAALCLKDPNILSDCELLRHCQVQTSLPSRLQAVPPLPMEVLTVPDMSMLWLYAARLAKPLERLKQKHAAFQQRMVSNTMQLPCLLWQHGLAETKLVLEWASF